MNLQSLLAAGTSEGAEKGWDARGRHTIVGKIPLNPRYIVSVHPSKEAAQKALDKRLHGRVDTENQYKIRKTKRSDVDE
jgi:hypothetical protein